MSHHRTQAIEAYGWTAVPRSVTALLAQSQATGPAPYIPITSLPIPTTPLSTAVNAYAKNHSLRVYSYGLAILQHAFPTWSTPTFTETYFLTSLLHDIGTTSTNIHATLLSFEFYGGILTLNLLKSLSAPTEQAESVAEAVIRHQDLGETGTLTRIGGLVQLATIFDNMGKGVELVAWETVESVVGAWPRRGWSGCFAETIRRENGLKPWAHTTHLGEEDFPNGVLGNELMMPFDNLD